MPRKPRWLPNPCRARPPVYTVKKSYFSREFTSESDNAVIQRLTARDTGCVYTDTELAAVGVPVTWVATKWVEPAVA